MATRKRKHPYGDGDDDQGKPYEEEGGAIEIHRAYLEHRVQGGDPPTPERYRRAIEQFQKLPGAVRSTPPAMPGEQEPEGGAEQDADKPADPRKGDRE
jgi:hypothetical protein